MKCSKCQADNPETLKFCGECGTQLPPHPFDFNSDNALYMYHLARAYDESGDLEKAREGFEDLVSLIGGRG